MAGRPWGLSANTYPNKQTIRRLTWLPDRVSSNAWILRQPNSNTNRYGPPCCIHHLLCELRGHAVFLHDVSHWTHSSLDMFCALVGRVEGVIEIWTSRVQKQSRVFNEELRVLVVRAVIGVGVDDQLRIRHVLLHDERVHRGYVHVVTAVHDECWLLDRLQIVGGPLLLDAPIADRFDLGGRHLVVHFGIAALLPTMRALQVLPSCRLARRGRTEFDREPDTLGRIVGVGTKEPPCSLGYQLHSLTAARTCAIDDQPANEIGRLQSDFLHDHAADRETKYVDLLQAQRLDEGDGVGGHLFECGRDLAGNAGDARVVEQDHLAAASQAIRHRWVPIIHGAEVVLIENERHAAGLAEPAIGEADSLGLDELCRRGLVAVLGHRDSLSCWLFKMTCETVEAGSSGREPAFPS